jgi:hypothetical protein
MLVYFMVIWYFSGNLVYFPQYWYILSRNDLATMPGSSRTTRQGSPQLKMNTARQKRGKGNEITARSKLLKKYNGSET